jgi:hypothetical protein
MTMNLNLFRKKRVNVDVDGYSITATDKRNNVPRFERVYKAKVDGIIVEVTIKDYNFSTLSYSGVMTQSDKRWVIFDPERPADRIIDQILLPKVKPVLKAILEADRQFRALPPSQFTDERGHVWVRKG